VPTLIERAPRNAKAKCLVCAKEVIHYTRGEDEFEKRKHAHLACAIEMRRELAFTALCSRDSDRELVDHALADVERLDAKLASEVRTNRAPAAPTDVEKRATPLDDPRTEELLRELEARPGDRDLLAVLADHMQLRGDERGEMLVLDLRAGMDPAALARRRELYAVLAPEIGDYSADKLTWGIGFLRKLELRLHSLDERAKVLTHPSCRLLEVLELYAAYQAKPLAIPPGSLPRSLRTLFVDKPAPADLSWLPYLEQLRIDDVDQALSHPTVRSLELRNARRELIIDSAHALPAVTKLTVYRGPRLKTIELLAEAGWLGRVHVLELDSTELGEHDVRALEAAYASRKLARLELRNAKLTADYRGRLARVCDELDFRDALPGKAAGVEWIENTKNPDLGRGRVVREFDGKVEVAFPSGTRTFKADAPFLKRTRES
jgi:hypothetical protein